MDLVLVQFKVIHNEKWTIMLGLILTISVHIPLNVGYFSLINVVKN